MTSLPCGRNGFGVPQPVQNGTWRIAGGTRQLSVQHDHALTQPCLWHIERCHSQRLAAPSVNTSIVLIIRTKENEVPFGRGRSPALGEQPRSLLCRLCLFAIVSGGKYEYS